MTNTDKIIEYFQEQQKIMGGDYLELTVDELTKTGLTKTQISDACYKLKAKNILQDGGRGIFGMMFHPDLKNT